MRLRISFNFLKESLNSFNVIKSYYHTKFAIFLRSNRLLSRVPSALGLGRRLPGRVQIDPPRSQAVLVSQ